MESETYYLEIAQPEDLLKVEQDLRKIMDEKPEPGKVTVQITLDFELILGIVGWAYTFWTFGKRFFFPDGKFRKPKPLELKRNFQIVTGVLALKNALFALWKDRKAGLSLIEKSLKKLMPA